MSLTEIQLPMVIDIQLFMYMFSCNSMRVIIIDIREDTHRTARKFEGEINLLVCQSKLRPPNYNPQYYRSHATSNNDKVMFGGPPSN